MNETQIADIWILVKEYVDKNAVESLAERYVDLLADVGVTDKIFKEAVGFDDILDSAILYYLDQGDDEVSDDDWSLDGDD